MDPGAPGRLGAIAVSRVAWERRSATTLVHTPPIVMEENVRVQYKRRRYATKRCAVGFEYDIWNKVTTR